VDQVILSNVVAPVIGIGTAGDNDLVGLFTVAANALGVVTGDGNDSISIATGFTTDLDIDTGTGDDTLQANTLSVVNNALVRMGNGFDVVAATNVVIGGTGVVIGGQDFDNFLDGGGNTPVTLLTFEGFI
jgi:hypothetical protein